MSTTYYYVSGETVDRIEVEREYLNLDDAKAVAGVIIEEGGRADVYDDEGNEYDPFD